ncbi:MAG: 50S ribosomal protein L6, partial [Rhodospirillales bacterium]|nr:50S ribosomal protein L6 [Rhodospirillales bacterium]
MSRIGKNPITVPDGVSVEIAGVIVTAKGKLGELSTSLTDNVVVTQEDNQIWVKPKDDSRDARKMWGTSRSVIDNLVVGVSEGFEKKLEINGVGYRAQIQGKSLNLQLGFSHDVNFEIPDGITIKCPDQTHIEISGADKQSVGQVAAVIRAYR